MTFLLWFLSTALAVGIAPGFIARRLTKGRGPYTGRLRQSCNLGRRLALLLFYLAVTVPWLVISWTGSIGAPWLITGLLLGIPASAWASKKWYRAFKDGSLGGGSDKYLPKSATGYVFYDEKRKRWIARLAPVDKETGKQKEFKRYCLTKTEARKKLQELKNKFEKGGVKSVNADKASFAYLAEIFKKEKLVDAVYVGEKKDRRSP